MENVATTEPAILFKLQPIGMFFLILRGAIIDAVTFRTLQLNRFTHYKMSSASVRFTAF